MAKGTNVVTWTINAGSIDWPPPTRVWKWADVQQAEEDGFKEGYRRGKRDGRTIERWLWLVFGVSSSVFGYTMGWIFHGLL